MAHGGEERRLGRSGLFGVLLGLPQLGLDPEGGGGVAAGNHVEALPVERHRAGGELEPERGAVDPPGGGEQAAGRFLAGTMLRQQVAQRPPDHGGLGVATEDRVRRRVGVAYLTGAVHHEDGVVDGGPDRPKAGLAANRPGQGVGQLHGTQLGLGDAAQVLECRQHLRAELARDGCR